MFEDATPCMNHILLQLMLASWVAMGSMRLWVLAGSLFMCFCNKYKYSRYLIYIIIYSIYIMYGQYSLCKYEGMDMREDKIEIGYPGINVIMWRRINKINYK